jgi:Ni/Fe-hydrogenase 1 B-type cytochrome subunit
MATTPYPNTPYRPLELHPQEAKRGHRYVWELPVRLTHFVTAVAITVLFGTGLFIAWPVVSSTGEPYNNFLLGRFREFHFLAGYALLLSFIVRGYWFIVGNKYARSGVPKPWQAHWWKALIDQTIEYMKVERGKAHLGHNSLAGLSYFVLVGGVGLAQIITGFALYGETNKGGFWDRLCGWVIPLLGGSFTTRMWHHTFAWLFVVFVLVHLYMTIFGSIRFRNGLISSIVSGDKFYRDGDIDYD